MPLFLKVHFWLYFFFGYHVKNIPKKGWSTSKGTLPFFNSAQNKASTAAPKRPPIGSRSLSWTQQRLMPVGNGQLGNQRQWRTSGGLLVVARLPLICLQLNAGLAAFWSLRNFFGTIFFSGEGFSEYLVNPQGKQNIETVTSVCCRIADPLTLLTRHLWGYHSLWQCFHT